MSESPRTSELPLVLGGHTFISQLGNDAPASPAEQRTVVESCLNLGLTWFDTTYQPERLALGRVFADLGRRHEAKVLAWNFFTDFGPVDSVGQPEYFRPEHIDRILEQLNTSWVDCLVIVPLADRDRNDEQEALAIEWQKKGYVRSLGHWVPDPPMRDRVRHERAFRYALLPFHVGSQDGRVLAAYKKRGWETIATSPFLRGWELDKMVAAAAAARLGEPEALRGRLADAMLRWVLFHPSVDRVMVAMRKAQWVERNLESIARGPLDPQERAWLERVRALNTEPQNLWRRLGFARRSPAPQPPR